MENVEKRRVIHLFNTWANNGCKRGACADISSGFLKRIIIFAPDLIACELQKSIVKLNKPVQSGFKILEDSKYQMYEFQYEFMKPKYKENAELMYMDTDSFLYNVKRQDFYADLKTLVDQNTSLFDTSNYPPGNQFGISAINASKLGCMKDELGSKLMTRFVALRAKCYAYETCDGDVSRRAKGVQRKVAAGLEFDDYLACLADRSNNICREQVLFKSDRHVVYTDIINKIALNGGDTKRYIEDNGIHTLTYGHYLLNDLN